MEEKNLSSGPEHFNFSGRPRKNDAVIPEGDPLFDGVQLWALQGAVGRLEAMQRKYPKEKPEDILLALLARDKQWLSTKVPSGLSAHPEDFDYNHQPRNVEVVLPEKDPLTEGVELWALQIASARLEAMQEKYPNDEPEDILLSLLARDKQWFSGGVARTEGKK